VCSSDLSATTSLTGFARAGTALANPVRLVVADPHADDDRGVEADKPRVAIVVRRPGLATDRTVHAKPPRGCAGAAIDHVLEHRQHLKGDLRRQHLLRLDVGAMHSLAVGVLDLDESAWMNAVAKRREDGKRGGEIQRGDE